MDEKYLKQMALTMKEKRNAYGYSQEQVAEMLDITYSYYTKLENGVQAPSLRLFVQIAVLLDLSLDKMIFGRSMDDQTLTLDTLELLRTISRYDHSDLELCRDLIDKIIFYLKN